MKSIRQLLLCCTTALLATSTQPADALSVAGVAASALKDYSGDAIKLFDNMRTPAALIGSSLIPIAIVTAPEIEKDDTKMDKFMKKANLVVALSSVLSEILAVVYSSITINKLTEVAQPATAGVAQLIAEAHELAWIGTNVHFIMGLLGFAVVSGTKAYFIFGKRYGKVGLGWAAAAVLQALSVINRGIAMGPGAGAQPRFACNFVGLIWRYLYLVAKNAKGGICSMAAVLVAALAGYITIKAFTDAVPHEE